MLILIGHLSAVSLQCMPINLISCLAESEVPGLPGPAHSYLQSGEKVMKIRFSPFVDLIYLVSSQTKIISDLQLDWLSDVSQGHTIIFDVDVQC